MNEEYYKSCEEESEKSCQYTQSKSTKNEEKRKTSVKCNCEAYEQRFTKSVLKQACECHLKNVKQGHGHCTRHHFVLNHNTMMMMMMSKAFTGVQCTRYVFSSWRRIVKERNLASSSSCTTRGRLENDRKAFNYRNISSKPMIKKLQSQGDERPSFVLYNKMILEIWELLFSFLLFWLFVFITIIIIIITIIIVITIVIVITAIIFITVVVVIVVRLTFFEI